MAEIFRSRDLILHFRGDNQPVAVSQDMLDKGWTGGQGVQWVDVAEDVRTVGFSQGLYGGVLIAGSDEAADQFTAMTASQETYAGATMLSGGNLLSTSTYERHTWASRQGNGPLVPIVYKANDILFFSLAGKFTNEDEATLANKAWAPNFFVGFVSMVPKASNGFWLGVQTSM